eukprot:m.137818 g.137818  ORF g.137818 m.137818 type:complete len:318 (-) comp11471_c0_seq3:102-1055(-)
MGRRRPGKKAMWSDQGRADSFTDEWPFQDGPLAPVEMAKAGFYHVGPEDNASCFMCGKDLDGWEADDEPMKEHIKHSTQCPFVNLHLEANRLKTFKFWPHKTFKHKAKAFAAAGFVHCPSDDATDMVRCFTCNKHLAGWEPEDDPWEEHKSHCKQCPFVWSTQAHADKENLATASASATESESAAPAPGADTVASDGPSVTPAASKDHPETTGSCKGTTKPTTSAPTPLTAAIAKAPLASVDATASQSKANASANVAPSAAAIVHVSDDMTVEEYFRAQCEMQTHTLVRSCEARMEQFAEQAATVRAEIEARIAAMS